MKSLILSAAGALALAGCGPAATVNSTDDSAEANVAEPDITEVPDESADANAAAQDVDDADEGADNAADDADGNASSHSGAPKR